MNTSMQAILARNHRGTRGTVAVSDAELRAWNSAAWLVPSLSPVTRGLALAAEMLYLQAVASAQTCQVSGKVVGIDGSAIAGASVAGGRIVTHSDAAGNFVLALACAGPTSLMVS